MHKILNSKIELNYRSLIKSIKDYAIFMIDKKGSILSWDQGAKRQFGYTRKEITGKNFSILFTPKDVKRKVPQSDLRIAQSKGRVLDEREYVKKNKETFWSTGVLTSTKDKSGHHEGFSKIMHDITEYRKAQRLILHQSMFDHLTRLPNRRVFEQTLKTFIAAAKKQKKLLALLFIDVNNFKRTNDKEGHRIGDLILIEIAARLTKNTREGDMAARLGGDEFVILLKEFSDPHDPIKVANKILKVFKPPIKVDKRVIHASVSIGVALYPQDGTDPGDLLHASDIALYEAKKAGGGVIRHTVRSKS